MGVDGLSLTREGSDRDRLRGRWTWGVGFGVLIVAGFVVLGWISGRWNSGNLVGSMPPMKLPDGTEMAVVDIAFTNRYTFHRRRAPERFRFLERLIPTAMQRRLGLFSRGSIGVGSSGPVLTLAVLRSPPSMPGGTVPYRIRVSDGDGNFFDGARVGGLLSMGTEDVALWQIPAFPRRVADLTVSFLQASNGVADRSIGSVSIRNPVYQPEFVTWTPTALPHSVTNQSLVVELLAFETGIGEEGAPVDLPPSPFARPESMLTLEFREADRPDANFGVAKVHVADATGNQWDAHLGSQRLSMDQGWAVLAVRLKDYFWPGESAWKLGVDLVRTGAFRSNEVFRVGPIPLPIQGASTPVDRTVSIDGVRARLDRLYPSASYPTNDWQWIVRYWGNRPNVYSMGVDVPEGAEDWRVKVLKAHDEDGRPVEVLEHRLEGHAKQGLFFKASPGAAALHLEVALAPLTGFDFMVKPLDRSRQSMLIVD